MKEARLFRLETLLAGKREEVRRRRRTRPEDELLRHPLPPVRDFGAALRRPGISVIAEMKRKSPSAGVLRGRLDPAAAARAYERASAAALSVLTDRVHFGGRDGDVRRARDATALPVLRKEFILDEYQVTESRAIGADAVLLIARILAPGALARLVRLAGALGLSSLVEVRGEGELEAALEAGAAIVGVNNRDLDTLETDLSVSLNLARRIPAGLTKVSESGIRTGEDARRLADAGYDALLVGEALLRAPDAGGLLGELARGPGRPA